MRSQRRTEVQGAKKKISEDYDLIKQRQKLIKQADSSITRWRVVTNTSRLQLRQTLRTKKKEFQKHKQGPKETCENRRRDMRKRTSPYPTINNNASEASTSTTTTGVWRSGICYVIFPMLTTVHKFTITCEEVELSNAVISSFGNLLNSSAHFDVP